MRVLARLLLVVALLFAQTAGVAHEIWHASSALASDDAGAPKGSPLCDFHNALGSVSAALSCAHNAPGFDSGGNSSPAGAEASAPRYSLLAAHSRGPPAFL